MKGIFLLIFLFSLQVRGDSEISPLKNKKLYIISDFHIDGFSWSDLALTQEEHFSGPVVRAWERWLKERFAGEFDDIQVCDKACLGFYEKWGKSLPEKAKEVDPQFNNSYFFKIDLMLRKFIQTYSWNGRAGFLEVASKRSFALSEIPEVKRKWGIEDQKTMTSSFATDVYRFSLQTFAQAVEAFKKEKHYQQVLRLYVSGHKRLEDIQMLVSELESKSKELGILYKIESFGRNESELLVYLSGEEKSFSDLLSRLKELKLSQSYKIVHESSNGKHEIKLNE